MRVTAFILSALLLVPVTATAGAQAVNAAPTPAVVKVTETNLPVALSDEELDEVTGEWVGAAVKVVTEGVKACAKSAACGAAAGYVGAKADKIVDAVVDKVTEWIKGK